MQTIRSPIVCLALAFAIAVFALCSLRTSAQSKPAVNTDTTDSLLAPAQSGAETEVQLTVGDVISTSVSAIVTRDAAYISPAEVFQLLKIKIDTTIGELYLRGFFVDEDQRYEIDAGNGRITLGGKTFRLAANQWNATDERLYLRTDVFDSVFHLHCKFAFRQMEVRMSTDFDLPIVRELKRAKLYALIRKGTEQETFDHAVPRTLPLMRGGMLDWSASLDVQTGAIPQYSFTITPAVQLVGGDAEVMYTGTSQPMTQYTQPQWRWHYADNDASLVRQITFGNGGDMPYTPIGLAPVAVQVTNHGTAPRTSYGDLVINDTTGPGWTVELWVNRVLFDQTVADNLGRYSFTLPMSYGATEVWVNCYGPYGEQRGTRKYIQIPYAYLRSGEIEYNLSGAYTTQQVREPFGGASMSVGVSSALTFSAGATYAPAGGLRWFTPYASLAARPIERVLVSAEFASNYRYGGIASYAAPFGGTLSASWYHNAEQVVLGGAVGDELDGTFTAPISLPGVHGAFTLKGTMQSAYGNTSRNVQAAFSGKVAALTLSSTVSGDWFGADPAPQSLSGAFSFTLKPFDVFSLRPTLEYDLITRAFTHLAAFADVPLWKNNLLSIGLDHYVGTPAVSLTASLRIDLPFASTSVSADHSQFGPGGGVSARGSFGWDGPSGALLADNHTWKRTGGLTFRPFLDLNNNGVRDTNEPAVGNLDVRVNGGRILESRGDSATRISDLEPYRRYVVQVSGAGFENIAWQPKYKSYGVVVEPNQFMELQVPVIVACEAIGTVQRMRKGKLVGLSGLLIRFRSADGLVNDSTFTLTDGSFDLLGLPAGNYSASLDEGQLRRLHLTSSTTARSFKLRVMTEGDVVDNLDFVLEDK